MQLEDHELSDEYREGVAHLQDFLESREEWRAIINDAQHRGHKVDPKVHADTMQKLREFDEIIEKVEASLAKEYDRLLAEKAKEAEFASKVAEAYQLSKEIYIHVKHETPHLLDSFTKQVLDPMTFEDREEFLDDVAILEATKLNAILKGEI